MLCCLFKNIFPFRNNTMCWKVAMSNLFLNCHVFYWQLFYQIKYTYKIEVKDSLWHTLEEERTRTIDYTQILPFWWSLPSLTAEVTLLDRCTLPQNATFKISSKRHKSLDKAHSPWWLSFPAHLSETLLLITAQPLQKFILAGIWLLCETKHLPLSETVIASIFSWWIPFQYLGLLWTSVFQMGFFTLIKYGT